MIPSIIGAVDKLLENTPKRITANLWTISITVGDAVVERVRQRAATAVKGEVDLNRKSDWVKAEGIDNLFTLCVRICMCSMGCVRVSSLSRVSVRRRVASTFEGLASRGVLQLRL